MALQVEGDRIRLTDLGSKNGTIVDAVPVASAWLAAGMRIELGRSRLGVVEERAAKGPPDVIPALVGQSPAMLELTRRIRRMAPLPLATLVRGETGTGKELVASALHELAPWREGPLVPVNCAAIPEQLAESELFGHERGAFTGATRAHTGAFVRAHGGTLFLDEIAELPMATQAKLLRALETGRVTPVGSERELTARPRVVAATHRDLEAMVRDGSFREDLLHRLSVLVLQIPPLRQRGDDIKLLLEFFAALAARELGRPVILDPSAMEAARACSWPGNVRALRNAVLRAAALHEGSIDAVALLEGVGSMNSSISHPAQSLDALSAPAIAVPRADYATMNRALIEAVVAEAGSVRKASRTLGVPRSTLGAWLKRR